MVQKEGIIKGRDDAGGHYNRVKVKGDGGGGHYKRER